MPSTTTRTGCADTSTNNPDRLAAPAHTANSVLRKSPHPAGGDPSRASKNRLPRLLSNPRWRQRRPKRSISSDRRLWGCHTPGSSSVAGFGNSDAMDDGRPRCKRHGPASVTTSRVGLAYGANSMLSQSPDIAIAPSAPDPGSTRRFHPPLPPDKTLQNLDVLTEGLSRAIQTDQAWRPSTRRFSDLSQLPASPVWATKFQYLFSRVSETSFLCSHVCCRILNIEHRQSLRPSSRQMKRPTRLGISDRHGLIWLIVAPASPF